MPVRDKAIAALARALDGPVLFNVDGTVKLGAREMTPDEFYERYGGAYIQMIDSIDWNRVLLEANSRHYALEHTDHVEVEDGRGIGIAIVCPECVCEALLAPDTGGRIPTDWQEHPRAPRDPRG